MNIPSKNLHGPVILVSRNISFTFPLSYAYLAGYLLERNENVTVFFKSNDHEALARRIIDAAPLLVGFGNLYPELQETAEIIEILNKKNRTFPIVIGGQMVSPIPEFAVEITGADFGVIGEGEITLYKLTKALREGDDFRTINGLVYREGEKIISNGEGEYIKDLSQLPPIPHELFPSDQWVTIGRWYTENAPQPHWRFTDRVANIHGGRGCPFKCNFCYHHSRPRYRAIEDMMADAEDCINKFDTNLLYFSDDLVLATPDRARQLINGIRSLSRKVAYSVSARFDSLIRIDDNLLREMKETGCRIMGLGIESGSDRILKIIGKNVNSNQILEQLKRLKEIGILPTVSIMVGQETETVKDVEASIELMLQSVRQDKNIQYSFTIATPFPGSKLHESLFSSGLVIDERDFYDKYFSHKKGKKDWVQVANLSSMTDQDVSRLYRKIIKKYQMEKVRQTSMAIPLLEMTHRALGKTNQIIKKIAVHANGAFPRAVTQSIGNFYSRTYDSIQITLERLRLYVLGLDQNL